MSFENRVSPSAKWNKSSLKRSVPAKWLKDVWQSPAAAPAFPWWQPKVRQGKYLLSLQHAPLGKSEEHSSGIPNTPKKLADLLAPPGKDLYFAILIRVKHCFQHIPIKKKKNKVLQCGQIQPTDYKHQQEETQLVAGAADLLRYKEVTPETATG